MENSLYAKNVYHISYSLCSLTTTVFVDPRTELLLSAFG